MIIKHEADQKPFVAAFLGDSITQFGWEQENGYVKQVTEGLANAGINIIPIPAGICGNTSSDMLNRMDKDVISKNSDIMFFMGGLNDIWLNKGTLEDYKVNINKILDKAKEHNIEVVLMNLTLISEDTESSMNKTIDTYNDFLKNIAKEKNIIFIDLNSEFKNELKKSKIKNENLLTTDGVHMNNKGNTLMANKIIDDFLKSRKN